MEGKNSFVREVAEKKYEYGFTTDVQTDIIEKGLSEDVVRLISQKKGEPEWLLEFRLNAYRYWLTMEQPTWGHLSRLGARILGWILALNSMSSITSARENAW